MLLDLAGYWPETDLTKLRLVEPACGTGAVLFPAVERLLWGAAERGVNVRDIAGCIRAFDIDTQHVQVTRERVEQQLASRMISARLRADLARQWVRHADFLLAVESPADVIVGNPPYVRVEKLSRELQDRYRARFRCLVGRADLYVAFVQRALELLADKGTLAFICADRWLANAYGAELRAFITSSFSVRACIDMHEARPFDEDVRAYPSVIAISRDKQAEVSVAKIRSADPNEAVETAAAIARGRRRPDVQVYTHWFAGADPWVLSSPELLEQLRALEAGFEPLTQTCRVGIGVCTGNDEVFIVHKSADIEADRLVPIALREDIQDGRLAWSGHCVIATFDGTRAIELHRYPRLQRYLSVFKSSLQTRPHVRSGQWWLTKERALDWLTTEPKLLIPDLQSVSVVYDDMRVPSHSLYWVISDCWDMHVLGALLSSRVALFFVWSYAIKQGSYPRFQAQYLRRIRLPDPTSLTPRLQSLLKRAFARRDFASMDKLACKAYGLAELPSFGCRDLRR